MTAPVDLMAAFYAAVSAVEERRCAEVKVVFRTSAASRGPRPEDRAVNKPAAAHKRLRDGRPTIVIDAAIMGGTACLVGTGVPAVVVAKAVAGGDGVAEVAADYGLTRGEVLLACYAVVSNWSFFGFTRPGHDPVHVAWSGWVDDVHGSLAGREGAPGLADVPDPPEVPL